MRVQNDNNGKSSYWVINPDAKPGKSTRRGRSGSVDGQPKDGKRKPRAKKLHQSTDDILTLSPLSMKLKQNRSCDNLLNVGSPCSSTDSISNIDDYHSPIDFSYFGENFNRPRSASNISTQSSINGSMTPVQIDIEEDLRLEENQLQYDFHMAEETANMVESINLDDSMKLMKPGESKYSVNDQPLIQRPKSDSFGSGDSGYESPAYFSPPQPNNPQILPLNKMTSPNAVPAKPPPTYNQALTGQMRPNQQMQNQMSGYFTQQQPSNRINFPQTSTAPRLKHPPLNTSPLSSSSQSNFNQTLFPQAQPQSMRYPTNMMQNSGMPSYNPYLKNTNIVAPNVTININSNMPPQQRQLSSQSHVQRTHFNNFNYDIPSDLTQVKLYDFDDKQQLANDLDAIIKNDLLTSNNNSVPSTQLNSVPSTQTTYLNYPSAGHNWVR